MTTLGLKQEWHDGATRGAGYWAPPPIPVNRGKTDNTMAKRKWQKNKQ